MHVVISLKMSISEFMASSPIIDKRLLERNMGDFENQSLKELCQQYPHLFEERKDKIQFNFELTPPNGEAFSDLKNRVTSCCEEMILPKQNYNVLVCSHNQTLKMMYFVLQEINCTPCQGHFLKWGTSLCFPI